MVDGFKEYTTIEGKQILITIQWDLIKVAFGARENLLKDLVEIGGFIVDTKWLDQWKVFLVTCDVKT